MIPNIPQTNDLFSPAPDNPLVARSKPRWRPCNYKIDLYQSLSNDKIVFTKITIPHLKRQLPPLFRVFKSSLSKVQLANLPRLRFGTQILAIVLKQYAYLRTADHSSNSSSSDVRVHQLPIRMWPLLAISNRSLCPYQQSHHLSNVRQGIFDLLTNPSTIPSSSSTSPQLPLV